MRITLSGTEFEKVKADARQEAFQYADYVAKHWARQNSQMVKAFLDGGQRVAGEFPNLITWRSAEFKAILEAIEKPMDLQTWREDQAKARIAAFDISKAK